jgi:putative phosphoribosyl transferase
MIFRDRAEAGQVLAGLLQKHARDPDTVVLGLPRGGVPVAYEVARSLRAPLDVFIVRKLGVPGHEELAMGAVASGGIQYLNQSVIDALRIDPATIADATGRENAEIVRRERLYRRDRSLLDVHGKNVILVDDGLATGSTMRAAIAALREHQPARIVAAVPAGSVDVCEEIGREADEAVCASSPEPFNAVGQWYQDFSQTTDEEVRDLLTRAWWSRAPKAS